MEKQNESEKVTTVNIGRIIRSLENTWTIIKPTCFQRCAKKEAEYTRIMKENRKEIGEKEYVKKENKKGRFGKWKKLMRNKEAERIKV